MENVYHVTSSETSLLLSLIPPKSMLCVCLCPCVCCMIMSHSSIMLFIYNCRLHLMFFPPQSQLINKHGFCQEWWRPTLILLVETGNICFKRHLRDIIYLPHTFWKRLFRVLSKNTGLNLSCLHHKVCFTVFVLNHQIPSLFPTLFRELFVTSALL